MGEGNENESLMNDRPHPGPLPQERENYFAVAGESVRAHVIVRPQAKSENAVRARPTSELFESTDGCSLSPGERVRMRASVPPTIILTQLQTLTRPAATLSRPTGEGQEREKRPPVSGDADAPSCRAVSSANDEKAGIAMVMKELSNDADSYSLSPGERVRVRASVHLTLLSRFKKAVRFVAWKIARFKSEMNNRPHPGLLPQEKEKRTPRSGEADAFSCRAVFSANDQQAAGVMEIMNYRASI